MICLLRPEGVSRLIKKRNVFQYNAIEELLLSYNGHQNKDLLDGAIFYFIKNLSSK